MRSENDASVGGGLYGMSDQSVSQGTDPTSQPKSTVVTGHNPHMAALQNMGTPKKHDFSYPREEALQTPKDWLEYADHIKATRGTALTDTDEAYTKEALSRLMGRQPLPGQLRRPRPSPVGAASGSGTYAQNGKTPVASPHVPDFSYPKEEALQTREDWLRYAKHLENTRTDSSAADKAYTKQTVAKFQGESDFLDI